MKFSVNVITEQSYMIEVDIPEAMEDKVYEEISCTPCQNDIDDVMQNLVSMGYLPEVHYDGGEHKRIEMWR